MVGWPLTHCSDNLRLKAKLVGETASKIVDSTFSITRHIWHFPYVIKHMTTCKEQYDNKANRSPQVSVLDDWEYVR